MRAPRGAFDTAVVNGAPRWLLTYANFRWRSFPELRHEIEDLVQETLMCALARGVDPLDSLRDGIPGRQVSQYLKIILKRRAIDVIRKTRGRSVCIECGVARSTQGVGRCLSCWIALHPKRPPRPPPDRRCIRGCGARVARAGKRCRSCAHGERWRTYRSAPEHDLVGRRFGRLVVTSQAQSLRRGRHGRAAYHAVRCDCGAEKTVQRSILLRGAATHCGCGRRGPRALCPGCGARVARAAHRCARCGQLDRWRRYRAALTARPHPCADGCGAILLHRAIRCRRCYFAKRYREAPRRNASVCLQGCGARVSGAQRRCGRCGQLERRRRERGGSERSIVARRPRVHLVRVAPGPRRHTRWDELAEADRDTLWANILKAPERDSLGSA